MSAFDDILETLQIRQLAIINACDGKPSLWDGLKAAVPEFEDEELADLVNRIQAGVNASVNSQQDKIRAAFIAGIEFGREIERRELPVAP